VVKDSLQGMSRDDRDKIEEYINEIKSKFKI
jgi:hypothetical protein